ncbi:MAG: ABC transporter substrate-binding protein [Pseudomonadota bacterium]
MHILSLSKIFCQPKYSFVVFALIVTFTVLSGKSAFSKSKPEEGRISDQKIVSIGGDITEILYALGLGSRIVAVDTTSLFPENVLKEKPNVGYMRALSAEGVLSIPASIILVSEGAGPPNAVAALKASSTKYVAIPDDPSAEGITRKIEAIAAATGVVPEGKRISAKISADFADLAKKQKLISQKKRVLFVLGVRSGRISVGGKGTSADGILQLAGVENAAKYFNGFKLITSEALVAMEPDAVILMKRRGNHSGDAFSKLQAVQLLSANKNGYIREMSGLYLLGFGPRTPDAAREVMEWLYPEITSKKE